NAHPEEARAYSDLKESLAVKYRTDPEGYTEAKSDFISEIDRKAREWERKSVKW
ncbi:GrpB family protein, partial [Candidatus Bipolaricaulota bacterium]|nr:GrpB family protein [Candidatus Bipolaricaulota bacterium]